MQCLGILEMACSIKKMCTLRKRFWNYQHRNLDYSDKLPYLNILWTSSLFHCKSISCEEQCYVCKVPFFQELCISTMNLKGQNE